MDRASRRPTVREGSSVSLMGSPPSRSWSSVSCKRRFHRRPDRRRAQPDLVQYLTLQFTQRLGGHFTRLFKSTQKESRFLHMRALLSKKSTPVNYRSRIGESRSRINPARQQSEGSSTGSVGHERSSTPERTRHKYGTGSCSDRVVFDYKSLYK